jgi:hypothetical protein
MTARPTARRTSALFTARFFTARRTSALFTARFFTARRTSALFTARFFTARRTAALFTARLATALLARFRATSPPSASPEVRGTARARRRHHLWGLKLETEASES